MSVITIDKPKIDISPEIRKQLLTQTEEMGQVVMHFLYEPGIFGSKIRIWPTSYLYDQHSSHRSELVHQDRISLYPEWTDVYPMVDHFFTLIFSGLPKACSVFNFKEECANQGNEFKVDDIIRNQSDVYYFRMLS
jgi:hypothetical protein